MENADLRNNETSTDNNTNEEEVNDEPADGNNPNDFRSYSLNEETEVNFNKNRPSTSSTTDASTAEIFSRPDKIDNADYCSLVSKLNLEQRDFLNHVTDHVRNEESRENPLNLFVTGGAGTGKSLLIKALYQTFIRVYDVGRERDL